MPSRLRGKTGFLCACVAIAAATLIGCSEPVAPPIPGISRSVSSVRPGRRVRAKIVSIRTNIRGRNEGFRHLVIYGNNRVRIGNEIDSWRLFDLAARTVITVDEPTKTYRTESLSALVRKRRELLATPIPDLIKPAEVELVPDPAEWNGIPVTRYRIRAGGYRREIWMSTTPIIPGPFWSMYLATEPLEGPYAGMMQKATGLLLQSPGFPVVDRSDIDYDGKSLAIEKVLEKIEERPVPASWLEVPRGYRNLTPPSKPAAKPASGRPASSSRPPDQSTPAAGSPPSSTTQKTP